MLRQREFPDLLGPGVEHADLVGGEFREDELPVLGHVAAPGPRGGRGHRIDQGCARLLGAAHIAVGEIHKPEIVPRVAGDPIGTMGAARQILERLDVLEFAGRRIEPVEGARAALGKPHLAVDMGILRVEHPDLDARVVEFRRQRIGRHLAGLLVEFCDRGLVHHRDPQIAVGVELEIERADRRAGLVTRQWMLGHLAGLGIERA